MASARMPLEVQVRAAAIPRTADASHVVAAVDVLADMDPARAEVRVPPLGAAEISDLDADAPPTSGGRVDHRCRQDRAHRLTGVGVDVVSLMRTTGPRRAEVVHDDVRSDDRTHHPVLTAARAAQRGTRQNRHQERVQLGQLGQL